MTPATLTTDIWAAERAAKEARRAADVARLADHMADVVMPTTATADTMAHATHHATHHADTTGTVAGVAGLDGAPSGDAPARRPRHHDRGAWRTRRLARSTMTETPAERTARLDAIYAAAVLRKVEAQADHLAVVAEHYAADVASNAPHTWLTPAFDDGPYGVWQGACVTAAARGEYVAQNRRQLAAEAAALTAEADDATASRTAAQKTRRQSRKARSAAAIRAAETPEQRAERLRKNREARAAARAKKKQ